MNTEKLALITIVLAFVFAVGMVTIGTVEEAKGISQSQSSNQNSNRQYIQSIQNQENTGNNTLGQQN